MYHFSPSRLEFMITYNEESMYEFIFHRFTKSMMVQFRFFVGREEERERRDREKREKEGRERREIER